MIYEKSIDFSTVDAVEHFKVLAKENGLSVLWSENLKEIFKDKGFFYPHNTYILEVCNAKNAMNILNLTHEAAYFLPYTVSIFETDESVKIGYAKSSKIIGQLTNGEESKHYAAEVEDILQDIIQTMASE